MQNKHKESMLISFKFVSSSSMYKPTNVGERGHPCLAPMLDIRLPCVLPFIQTFAWLVCMAFTTCCSWDGTPNRWRCTQSLSCGIMSIFFWNQQNKNRDIKLQMHLVWLKYFMWGCGSKWIYLLWNLTLLSSGSSLPLIFCIHMRSGPIYRGVIYLAKKIIRWWYFTCKKRENIIRDGILHVNIFHYFEIPYFTCTFFTKSTYNE